MFKELRKRAETPCAKRIVENGTLTVTENIHGIEPHVVHSEHINGRFEFDYVATYDIEDEFGKAHGIAVLIGIKAELPEGNYVILKAT